jgi:UBA-like domain
VWCNSLFFWDVTVASCSSTSRCLPVCLLCVYTVIEFSASAKLVLPNVYPNMNDIIAFLTDRLGALARGEAPPVASVHMHDAPPSQDDGKGAMPSDSRLVDVDPEKLQSLIDMGFDEGSCRRALVDSNGDVQLAAVLIVSMPDATSSEAAPVDHTEDIQHVLERMQREEQAEAEAARVKEEKESLALIELLRQRSMEDAKRRKDQQHAQEEADRDTVRMLLNERREKGQYLSREEYNFLLAPKNHKDGDLYQCMICFSDDLTLDDLTILNCSHFQCKDVRFDSVCCIACVVLCGVVLCDVVSCCFVSFD